MRLVRLFLTTLLGLPIVCAAFAASTDKTPVDLRKFKVIQAMETLSQIASSERMRSLYPGTSLYGPGGRLDILLSLNPSVADPDFIFPGQAFLFVNDSNPANRSIASHEPASQQSDIANPTFGPEITQTPENIYFSWLKVDPTVGFYRLEVTDTFTGVTGTLVSKLSPGLHLNWRPELGDGLHLGLGLDFTSLTWQVPPNRALSNSRLSVFGFHAEVGQSLFRGGELSLKVGNSEQVFLRSVSSTELAVEKVPLMYAGPEFRYSFLSRGPFEASATLGAGITFSGQNGTTEIKRGHYYRSGLGFSQALMQGVMTGGLEFQRHVFSTSFSENAFEELKLSFGYSFSIGR
ncbi:MAG: hypothetical protein H7301_00830 [Cryobacterium sp.]|nr:hypothetical protein [Oligoflexia bacterium]